YQSYQAAPSPEHCPWERAASLPMQPFPSAVPTFGRLIDASAPPHAHVFPRSPFRCGISVTTAERPPTCDGVHARRRRGLAAVQDIIVRIIERELTPLL